MPAATAYSTEQDLGTFLLAELGRIAGALGWTLSAAALQHVINQTLRAAGVTTIDQATDVVALEALGIREAWRLAVKHLAAAYDFSLDQQSMSRSQMQKMAKDALSVAEATARVYDTSRAASVVTIHTVTTPTDPYGVRADLVTGSAW